MRRMVLLCFLSCSHPTLADDAGNEQPDPTATVVTLEPSDLQPALDPEVDQSEQLAKLLRVVVEAHPDIVAEIEAEAQETRCVSGLGNPWMEIEKVQSCVKLARTDEVEIDDVAALYRYLQLRFPDLLAGTQLADWTEVLGLATGLLQQDEIQRAQRQNAKLLGELEAADPTKPCPVP